ncbi:hypothetical protein QBC43DRAFT_319111 [Cladorrhinum sp. PSN259]|nr:hypothetical protein QBC43DRAFT_319111 [Cladorrhinum sp. PSN259]
MKCNNLFVSAGLPLLMLAGKALGFGCQFHTFGTCADGIVHWYDPDDGQICDPFDCGGGRAPPRTDVPGCPQYKGTAIRQTAPSYMPCFQTPGLSTSTTSVTVPAPSPTTTPPAATDSPADTTSTSSTLLILSTTLTTDGSIITQTITQTGPAPSTTKPATLPDGQGAGSGSGSQSTSSTSTSTTATGNGANFMGGSLVAVAGAVVGVMALV